MKEQHMSTPPGRVMAGLAIVACIGVVIYPGLGGVILRGAVLVVLAVAWRMTVQANRLLLETSRLLVEMAAIQQGTAQVQAEADERLALLDDWRDRRYGR
jgi:hypothetical protein